MGFLADLHDRVTTDMNEILTSSFTTKEVEDALKEMNPTKVPSPDGMPPIFFQQYWSTVGSSVTSAVLKALNDGHFPGSLNHTFISLIPKIKKPVK